MNKIVPATVVACGAVVAVVGPGFCFFSLRVQSQGVQHMKKNVPTYKSHKAMSRVLSRGDVSGAVFDVTRRSAKYLQRLNNKGI